MAWNTENRRTEVLDRRPEPYLTEALKDHLAKKYFPRYPTKRAVLLPALHAVQHTYNWIPPQAMEELADFLGLAPAEVMDTATFYEEYWLRPKGKYLVQVCRSLACELCGSNQVTDALKAKLGVEVGETTDDRRFTLIELECLGACGSAPVMLVNEAMQENVSPASAAEALDKLPDDPHDYKESDITWETNDLPHVGHNGH
jgi:NADH-quinone oxidoreductase subunit E